MRELDSICEDLPSIEFDDGACADLALVLFRQAQNLGLSPSLVLIYRTESDEEGSFEMTGLSHVVVEIDGETIDAGGIDAEQRWYDRWDPKSGGWQNEDGLESSFFTDSVESEAGLIALCEKYRVPTSQQNQNLITEYLKSHEFKRAHKP